VVRCARLASPAIAMSWGLGVWLSIARRSFVIAFRNLVAVYDSVARRGVFRFCALCLGVKVSDLRFCEK
jgi:hypothetical protein